VDAGGWSVWRAGPDPTPGENGQARCAIPRVVSWGFGAIARARSALWLKQTFPQLDREHRAMAVSLGASFAYKNNMDMTDEIKNALGHLDLDKTGRVSTSELVAAAKALVEVRQRLGSVERGRFAAPLPPAVGRACCGVAGTMAWWGGVGVMQGRRGEGTRRIQARQWHFGERYWQSGERCGGCSGFAQKGGLLGCFARQGVVDY